MNALKMMSIVMIVAGTQGLAYGGLHLFNASESGAPQAQEAAHAVALMPSWAGLAAVAVGIVLFVLSRKRRTNRSARTGDAP